MLQWYDTHNNSITTDTFLPRHKSLKSVGVYASQILHTFIVFIFLKMNQKNKKSDKRKYKCNENSGASPNYGKMAKV